MKRSALFWVFLAPVLMWLFLLIVLPHIDLLIMSLRSRVDNIVAWRNGTPQNLIEG